MSLESAFFCFDIDNKCVFLNEKAKEMFNLKNEFDNKITKILRDISKKYNIGDEDSLKFDYK